MSSTDLVPSSNDLADSFLREALTGIARAGVEKRINAHYFKRAEKLYNQIWRKCRRTTGHSMVADQYYASRKNCRHCGAPQGENTRERRRNGIQALAIKLRDADRAAGIEWTP